MHAFHHTLKPDEMRNERPDMLDIIFEHRNKDYGAYALRRGYASTMVRSLFAGVGITLTTAVLLSMRTPKADDLPRFHVNGIELTKVDPPPAPDPVKPPPSRPPVHTVDFVTPRIVPTDQVDRQDQVKPIDSLIGASIGTQDISGTDPVGNTPTPAPAVAPAQEPAPVVKEVYESYEVDDPAEYPGGSAAMGRFLQQRLQDPRDGSDDASGQVKLKVIFVVGTEGDVGAFRVQGDGDARFGEEVVRVLRKMPRWKPARQRGRPVPMYFALPVVFDQRTE